MDGKKGWRAWLSKESFGYFFVHFTEKAIKVRRRQEQGKWFSEEQIIKNIYSSLKPIPVRVLISDIHMRKEAGDLCGASAKEEYEFYNKKILSSRSYFEILRGCYPELFRLLELRMNQALLFFAEAERTLTCEKEEIKQKLCDGTGFSKVTNLLMVGSDAHNGGKTVLKICLDNGYTLVYKPHNIQNEALYQKIYVKFCERMNLQYMERKFVVASDHGWERCLKYRECQETEEVKRYYTYMGIHLFLAWLFGATDLHTENLLAIGEFPVVLDAETFPGIRRSRVDQKFLSEAERRIEESAEQIAKKKIENSVLQTGMLPVAVAGMRPGNFLSALNTGKRQESEIKIPFVQFDKTSDIRISYQKASMENIKCIPQLDGRIQNPCEYLEEICEGFKSAFYVWKKSSLDLKEIVEKLFRQNFRMIRRSTQQYMMLQMISLHPNFLKSRETRNEFLQRLRKWDQGSITETDRRMQDYEISSLMNLDIPIFYGNGKSIEIQMGSEFVRYFKKEPEKTFESAENKMDGKELQWQLYFIRSSLAWLRVPSSEFVGQNVNGFQLKNRTRRKKLIKTAIQKVASQVIKRAVITQEKDITWIDNFQGKYNPMDVYLYHGIAGMALFFAKLRDIFPEAEYEIYFQLLKNKLFLHTKQQTKVQRSGLHKTGALEGEGSIILTYLYLYKICGKNEKEQYLSQAVKHMEILRNIWQKDVEYDFLSGNAGAIYALGKLYQNTGDKRILELAVQIGEWLWERRKEYAYGCGWIVEKESIPLTGMAHGCSGFVMAYALLLRETGRALYEERIRKIMNYENTYYSKEERNWKDLRECGQDFAGSRKSPNGWCHGAPGILLARLELVGLQEFISDTQVWQDIAYAVDALILENGEDKYCLCHGVCGNALILRKYLMPCGEKNGVSEERKQELLAKMDCWFYQIADTVCKGIDFSYEEQYRLGFMDGNAGIGFALLLFYEKYAFETNGN